jgi:ferredoxin
MTAVWEGLLPQFDGTRCVHGAIETSTCEACVKACPKGAWRLDDAALEFDSGQCDGCGLCVPVCPRRAIALPLSLARRPVAGTNAMLAACAYSGGDAVNQDEPGRIACLHAIGLVDLLRAYQKGIRVWLLAHGECAGCSRGGAESLFSRVDHLNTALRQRGQRTIMLREISLASWSALINVRDATVDPARRGFLRSLTQPASAVVLDAAPMSEQTHPKPSGEYLPEGDDALMPWVASLDPARCVGCHACVRVCPEGAIHFDAEAPAYRFRHRACTGCGLCQDVCEHQAITLQPWTEPSQWTLPLVEQRCPSCGVIFHTPAEAAIHTRYCWVCASSKQKQRLYQVMA